MDIREKKSQIEKKSKLGFTTCKKRLSVYVDEERLEPFMVEIPIIQKPVHCFAEQINGLVSTRQERSLMKELMLCYLHVYFEIYSLIMTK